METTTTRIETSAGAEKPSLNPDALNQLLEQLVNDLGAAVNGALVVLGDDLGIYAALADIGPATSQQRPSSMSDSFGNGLVPRLLLDTLAMMRPATLFFSLPSRSQYSLIQIVLPR
jgi:hypothetical protein